MKKMIALLLTLAMLLTLGACTAKTEPTEETKANNVAVANEAASEAQTDNPAQTEADGGAKLIGLNLCTTQANLFYMVWDSVKEQCNQRGWDLMVTVGTGETVLENTRTMLAQDVDAIIEFGCNPEYQAAAYEEAKEQNVPVVAVDIPSGDDPCFFGADSEAAGTLLGETLGKMVIDKWDGQIDAVVVLYVAGNDESPVAKRTLNVAPAMESVGVAGALEKQVVFGCTSGDVADYQEKCANFLSANPDMRHIVVVTDTEENCPNVLAAIEMAGRSDDVMLGSHSETRLTVENFESEEPTSWVCTIAYNFHEYGDYICKMLDDIFAGKEVGSVLMQHTAITADNYKDYEWLLDYAPTEK